MSKPTWSDRAMAVWSLIGDRPIAYHPLLAKALDNDINCAIFLTQMIYWSDKGTWRPGWTVKGQAEIYDETSLTRYQQERVRKKLGNDGLQVLQEQKKGVPARLMFRVRFGNLNNLLAKYMEANPPTTDQQCEELAGKDAGNSHTEGEELASKDAGNSHTITETTPETTSETPSEKSAAGASQTEDIDEVFPDTAEAKAATPEWSEPPKEMSPEEAAEMAAPGASAGMTRQPVDEHPAYNVWKTSNYRIGFPFGLSWTAFFEYARLFSDLFGIPIPMNRRGIGQWRVGLSQSIGAFGEDLKAHGENLDHGRIMRRAAWGLQVLHARRDLGHAYDFSIVSPTSVAKTLRTIAGDLRRIEAHLALDNGRLPQKAEIMDWYSRAPGTKKPKLTGSELTEQTLRNIAEEVVQTEGAMAA